MRHAKSVVLPLILPSRYVVGAQRLWRGEGVRVLRPPQGALPTRPQPEPQPTPPAAAKCIPVHGGDYYSAVVFDALGQNLAEVYREEDNFKNQWGLSHVNLLKGEDDKPGTGVTIGFLDSGIAADHCLAVLGEDIQLAYYGPAPDSTPRRARPDFRESGLGMEHRSPHRWLPAGWRS